VTAAELIAKLQQYPPDTPVVTPGFDESDYDYVEEVRPITVAALSGGATFSGSLVSTEDKTDRPLGEPFDAVLINF